MSNCQLRSIYVLEEIEFRMFPFFKILPQNKSLRKFYKDFVIDKFKPFLNNKILRKFEEKRGFGEKNPQDKIYPHSWTEI